MAKGEQASGMHCSRASLFWGQESTWQLPASLAAVRSSAATRAGLLLLWQYWLDVLELMELPEAGHAETPRKGCLESERVRLYCIASHAVFGCK